MCHHPHGGCEECSVLRAGYTKVCDENQSLGTTLASLRGKYARLRKAAERRMASDKALDLPYDEELGAALAEEAE